ncbi:flavodoxin-dependent (E)-4-hydroxy-3-methylbut-2-enyl-diphosphate synthase [Thermobrachium celere]|uniref:flavodoxin-dependent (E)-4-hydroxy-3-methylbut-2-enyl-diphosphate synthase n=1 Tax=Thermobrachium celere TaxID=53422 RepID=UPI0019447FBA|nr:flavodoxin-dependent (E)-4-hydroxy-3-methylbut-2-enyl-diphosphate synthase [Thermobrachium celere]GFR35824.1 4-hydroxy-3-methylbut-2-en-1-yl diphosphate synthase (flavodoxin) [Thermobrachium celere]
MNRRKTKKIKVGNIFVGGDAPITVQSMTNTDTRDVKSTVNQIKQLEKEGCEIIRVAVPDMEAADAIKEIIKQIKIPLVADIHFDYRLAIKSLENGVNALRINPGNIGDENKVKEVVNAAKYYGVPIRVGVNSGSLEKELLEKYKRPCPQALVESALKNVEILEKYGFYDIVLSVKSSNVVEMVESYRLLSKNTDYPLHVGVTEAGTKFSGTVKSSIGIGALLLDGIGDTIRVSLTDDPVEEVRLGKEILQACGVRKFGVEIISCPTCGRTAIDLIGLANKIEKELKHINKPIKVAVMGCVVNGPGEAKEADIGIAGGKNEALIFKKGEIIKKVKEENIIEELINEINKL